MNYHAECYIKELQLKPAGEVRIACEPASGWMVERDTVKYLVLEEANGVEANGLGKSKGREKKMSDNDPEKNKCMKALLFKDFSCVVKNPCDVCLLKNLLQVKLNKARVRIKVVENKNDFTLEEIHVI